MTTKLNSFGAARRVATASAPGRLDVMGGIADYSGSLVLEMPIRERAVVSAALRFDGVWSAHSAEAAGSGFNPLVSAKTQDLFNPEKARAFFARSPRSRWAAYVLGCVPFLIQEKNILPGGADIHLRSGVPLAKGLSSSAAIEVAAMTALGKLYGLSFGKTELPRLCQRTENLVAGAPCGLMDQLTCYLGRRDRLLPILCRPDKVLAPIPVPKGLFFLGVDSGVRHWVGGTSYSEVRAAAFMGYSLIALGLGAKPRDLERARDRGDASRLPFGGYLAAISPRLFNSRFRHLLPEKMTGRDFLRRAVSIDKVTEVKPDVRYRVRSCAQHPVDENARVKLYRDLLLTLDQTQGRSERTRLLLELGDLMFQSHASYGDCGLGEPVTDAIAGKAWKAGPEKGVYGAKITGGGSGGTVCLLVEGQKGLETARRIAASTAKGSRPFISLGSSDGAKWS